MDSHVFYWILTVLGAVLAVFGWGVVLFGRFGVDHED